MEVDCSNCGITFERIPSQLRSKNGFVFCSRTCSAQLTNRIYKKRKPLSKKCKTCRAFFAGGRSVFCPSCKDIWKEKAKKTTLAEVRHSIAVRDKHPSWFNSRVRVNNRIWNRDLTKLPCQVCGYATHVELCHIKGIHEFCSTTSLAEVNDPSNLLVLCRNHHWELDHGILSHKDVPARKKLHALSD